MATFYIRNTTRQPGYQITADNWNELNGDLNELNRRIVFQLPAESWKPRSGGVMVEPDETREDYRITYPNAATGIATYRLIVPMDFSATNPSPLEIRALWYAPSTGAVRWAAIIELVQRGEAVGRPRTSTAVEVTTTYRAANSIAATNLTIPAATLTALPADANTKALGAGDTLRIRLERRGSHHADTNRGVARVLHVIGRLQASATTQIT